jgi:hypothetical protein
VARANNHSVAVHVVALTPSLGNINHAVPTDHRISDQSPCLSYKLADVLVNRVLAPVPTVDTATRQTTAISASINPYSTIVAASSRRANLRNAETSLITLVSPERENKGSTAINGDLDGRYSQAFFRIFTSYPLRLL